MKKNIRKFRFLFVLIPLAMLFAVSGLVMWLWNALLPNIIGVKNISYWQAMGIFVLSKILFGGFHGKGCRHHRKMEKLKHHEAFLDMTDEEKEKLREAWKNRCAGNFFRKNQNM